jgi:hypothetical protein
MKSRTDRLAADNNNIGRLATTAPAIKNGKNNKFREA